MDSVSVSDLLTAWGLQQYVETFANNQITTDILRDMEPAEMKLLIDCVAHIIILRKKRDEWIKQCEQQSQFLQEDTSMIQFQPSTSHQFPHGQSLQDGGSYTTLDNVGHSSSSVILDAWRTASSSHYDSSQWSSSGSWTSTPVGGHTTPVVTPESGLTPVLTPGLTPALTPEGTPSNVTTGSNMPDTSNIFVALDKPLIHRALSRVSNSQKQSYLNMTSFMSYDRQAVAQAIMKYIFSHCPQRTLSTIDFMRIRDLIIEQFPFERETSTIWFKLYRSNDSDNDLPEAFSSKKDKPYRSSTSGLLYEIWRNLRNKGKKEGVIEFKKRRPSQNRENQEQEDSELNKSIATDTFITVENTVVQNYLQWLETATPSDSFETIKLRWEETSRDRLQCLQAGNEKFQSIIQYFNTYRILRDPERGPVLINMDFDILHPGRTTCLIEGLLHHRDKIITLAKAVKERASDCAVSAIAALPHISSRHKKGEVSLLETIKV